MTRAARRFRAATAEIGSTTERLFLGEVVLPGAAAAVPVARHCAAEILRAAGHKDVYAVQLVVSELVSNAYLHSASHARGGRITVKIADVGTDTVYVEVVDAGSSSVPRPRVAEPDGTTGRGLWLVSRLSARWGVAESGLGRGVVWAELCMSPDGPASGKENFFIEEDIAMVRAEVLECDA